VLTALNKIDLLNDSDSARQSLTDFPNSVAISALSGEGIPDLLTRTNFYLYQTFTPVVVRLPYNDGALIAAFHEQGQVDRVEQVHQAVLIHGRLPGRLLAQFQPYIVGETGLG